MYGDCTHSAADKAFAGIDGVAGLKTNAVVSDLPIFESRFNDRAERTLRDDAVVRNHLRRRFVRIRGSIGRSLIDLAGMAKKDSAQAECSPDVKNVAACSEVALDGDIAGGIIPEAHGAGFAAVEVEEEAAIGAIAGRFRFERGDLAIVAITVLGRDALGPGESIFESRRVIDI